MGDRPLVNHWLNQDQNIQLKPLRFGQRWRGINSWENRARWTIGTAVLGDGKETKRKRELIKADSTTEDEDEGSRCKG